LNKRIRKCEKHVFKMPQRGKTYRTQLGMDLEPEIWSSSDSNTPLDPSLNIFRIKELENAKNLNLKHCEGPKLTVQKSKLIVNLISIQAPTQAHS
jgi:hypothetical protein